MIEVNPRGRYGRQWGWITVEQITDYENRERGDRPRFEAAVEYVRKLDEPLAPAPFLGLWERLGG